MADTSKSSLSAAPADALGQYLDLYKAHESLLESGSPDVLGGIRPKALALLEKRGLPTRRNERYRYSDVAAALAPDYGLNLHRRATAEGLRRRFPCNLTGLNAMLVYVEGDVVHGLSTHGADAPPEGVEIVAFSKAAPEQQRLIAQKYASLSLSDGDALSALNSLLLQDGLLIHIKEGVQVERVVQVVNVSGGVQPSMHNRRLLIVAERGAACNVLLCDWNYGPRTAQLSTEVVEVFCEEDSRVDVYDIEETRVENHRFCNVYVEQESRSSFSLSSITLRAGFTRNTVGVCLKGAQAVTKLQGALIADGNQHCDNHLLIEHGAPACQSEMLYKYVLDDHSVGAFAGKVLVNAGAQKTESRQTSANLCASPDARAFSQPMLEIYADDVKCAHGATVGKLDETALLYMRQRGISEAEARLILQEAFVGEVMARIAYEPLRERLASLVEHRFRRRLSGCTACDKCASGNAS